MDILEIAKEKIKTVKLSISIWKRLSMFKLDYDKSTFEDAISDLLSERGY